MSSTILTSGDLNNGVALSSGNDGTVIIQSGPVGAKVNALSIAANGNISLPASAAPCFSAYQSTAQSLATSTSTKLQFQTKEFDTANAFDAVTNFRFTPQVAGYYQVSGGFSIASAQTQLILDIYKNGSQFKRVFSSSGSINNAAGSCLVFLNGSTDYVELFGFQAAAAQNTVNSPGSTYFQASLIRPA